MTTSIRWGILGCGRIAGSFAKALALLPDADLVAVAARDGDRAQAFAATHGAARAHAGYEALANDAGVDVVYIATTSAQHRDHAELCLRAGRHVLCEKPLTTSVADSQALIACARAHDRFLMEGMWTRFLPVYATVRAWIVEGRIGRLSGMRGDFSSTIQPERSPRHFDPALGGGALLDLGVYPVAMAFWLFGQPLRSTPCLRFGPTGVDVQGTLVLDHAGGEQSTCVFGMEGFGSHDLHLFGSTGSIRVPGAWWAKEAHLFHGHDLVETAKPDQFASGYAYEAMEVMRCLRAGLRESPGMPLEDSLGVARCLEEALTGARGKAEA